MHDWQPLPLHGIWKPFLNSSNTFYTVVKIYGVKVSRCWKLQIYSCALYCTELPKTQNEHSDKRNVGKRLHHAMTWPWWLLNEVWKWNVQWSSPPLSFVLCDTPTHIHLTWKGETEVSEDYLIVRINSWPGTMWAITHVKVKYKETPWVVTMCQWWQCFLTWAPLTMFTMWALYLCSLQLQTHVKGKLPLAVLGQQNSS